jgi:hypothetical protein
MSGMVDLDLTGLSTHRGWNRARKLLEKFSWFLGVDFDCLGNFWEVEHPPADWRT